jgi:hypothetical protein
MTGRVFRRRCGKCVAGGADAELRPVRAEFRPAGAGEDPASAKEAAVERVVYGGIVKTKRETVAR